MISGKNQISLKIQSNQPPDWLRKAKKLKSRCLIQLQHCHKCLLRHIHLTHRLHPLLPFCLFLQQFLLTRNITAIALRKHILTNRTDARTGNNPASKRSLQGNFELLAGNQFLELFNQALAHVVGLIPVDDCGKRICPFSIDQHIQAHQFILAIPNQVVLH